MYFIEVSSRRGCQYDERARPDSTPIFHVMSLNVQSLLDLDGRVALVTGASSGFGDRFARVLYAAGASVVAAARRTDRLDALASSIDDEARFAVVTADVTSDADCERLVDTTIERFGRVDILVNNAGTAVTLPAEIETPTEFRG